MTCRQAFLGDGPPPPNRELASYAAKDAEDLQRAIVAGQVEVVVVCDIGVLIAAMLDGDICLNDWAAHNVSLEIAGRDEGNSGRTAVASATTTLTAAQTSISTWHARLRRRRTIAGAILSVIAIACAAALTALAR